jgi:hypothetical protein
MKKRQIAITLLVISALVSVISTSAIFGKSDEKTEVTLQGEVVDLHCYITRHNGGKGAEHAGCANSCISRGVTPGFLASDGKLYVLFNETMTSPKDKIAGFAGQQAKATGIVMERDGMKAIAVKSIEKAE